MKKIKLILSSLVIFLLVGSCGTTRSVNTTYEGNNVTERTVSKSNVFGKKDIAKLKEDWQYDMLIEEGEAPVLDKYDQPARNKLLARKGAVLEAQRKLAEKIGVIRLNATTTMQDFATSDIVQSRLNVYLKDVEIISEDFDEENGTYKVTVQMPKLKIVNILEEYYD